MGSLPVVGPPKLEEGRVVAAAEQRGRNDGNTRDQLGTLHQ